MCIRLNRAVCFGSFLILLAWSAVPAGLASPAALSAQMGGMGGQMGAQMGGQRPSPAPIPEEIGGHVLNGTTGKPQAGVDLQVVKIGESGKEVARTVQSDAQGRFKLGKAEELLQSPHLLRAEFQGVTYTLMLRPMGNLADLEMRIYEATDSPQGLRFSIPNMMIRRQGDTLTVDEIHQVENRTNRSYSSREGSFRFYAPPAMTGQMGVSVTPAGSTMPIAEQPVQLPDGKSYKLDTVLKPGRTQIHLHYQVSYAGGRASVPRKFFNPIDTLSLAVSPEDIEVTSNLLLPPKNEESTGFKMRSAADIPAEKEITIDLAGGSSLPADPAPASGAESNQESERQQLVLIPPEISRYQVLIVFNLAVLMAAFLGWRLTSRDSSSGQADVATLKKGVSRGKLLKQREGLLDLVADLDDQLEAQAISSRDHQQKRQALKGQLIEITRFLEKNSADSLTRK